MEDFQLDIVLGKGPAARSIRLDLPRFTLVGATTRTGLITGPLRDRFGLVARLDYYSPADLETIVVRAAGILGVTLPTADADASGAREIARRARGTPRIANRLLRRVRDYAEVRGTGSIDQATARDGLAVFGVDDLGLDKVDRAILGAICERFGGGPVGLVHPGHQRGRADRDGRGRLRAVPDHPGPADAHARGAGWSPPRPGPTWASSRRPARPWPWPTSRPTCSADERLGDGRVTITLSNAQARRISLGAQGFAEPRPAGRVDRRHLRRVLDRMGLIQIDSVNVLVRSQELTLFARLGAHPRTLIADASQDGELFEYWVHEASLVPIAQYDLYRWRMGGPIRWPGFRRWVQAHGDYIEEVYRRVVDEGPLVAGRPQGPSGQERLLVGSR